jgi:hypothetical protein
MGSVGEGAHDAPARLRQGGADESANSSLTSTRAERKWEGRIGGAKMHPLAYPPKGRSV